MKDISASGPRASGKLRAYAELLRLPNVFTAMADVLMGWLVTHATLEPFSVSLSLTAASSLLYLAGMVLNDYYDRDIDARERPGRPLPSGRIEAHLAGWIGYELLIGGLALAWLGGALVGSWSPGLMATALAAAVVLYDFVIKRTPLGPLGMGACRFLNVLLGMSAVAAWHPMYGVIAAGIGVYIVGLTWFARSEAGRSRRTQLMAALVVMLAGIGLLASFPRWVDESLALVSRPQFAGEGPWLWLMAALALVTLAACGWAIADPRPQRVQQAVKQSILSLIVLDAAVCLAVRGPAWSLVILALLLPTTWLGRKIYST